MGYEVKSSGLGYYTLYIDGEFAGNFDTKSEALREYTETVETG